VGLTPRAGRSLQLATLRTSFGLVEREGSSADGATMASGEAIGIEWEVGTV
jgi:hypothetical protein